jgi:hypothetical protein
MLSNVCRAPTACVTDVVNTDMMFSSDRNEQNPVGQGRVISGVVEKFDSDP